MARLYLVGGSVVSSSEVCHNLSVIWWRLYWIFLLFSFWNDPAVVPIMHTYIQTAEFCLFTVALFTMFVHFAKMFLGLLLFLSQKKTLSSFSFPLMKVFIQIEWISRMSSFLKITSKFWNTKGFISGSFVNSSNFILVQVLYCYLWEYLFKFGCGSMCFILFVLLPSLNFLH